MGLLVEELARELSYTSTQRNSTFSRGHYFHYASSAPFGLNGVTKYAFQRYILWLREMRARPAIRISKCYLSISSQGAHRRYRGVVVISIAVM